VGRFVPPMTRPRQLLVRSWMRWSTRTWGLLAMAVLLPIAVLSVYSYRVTERMANRLVQTGNEDESRMAAELISQTFEQRLHKAVTLSASPDLVAAVEAHDEEAVRKRLLPAVQFDGDVDRAVVLDPAGVLWSDYPRAPEALGTNFSHRDYFKSVSQHWEPCVSGAFLRVAAPQVMVVAVAVPIRNHNDQVIGVLLSEYRLDRLAERFRHVRIGEHGFIIILDHTGAVVVHAHVDAQTRQYTEYQDLAPVRGAMEGAAWTGPFEDPLTKQIMMASFVPVTVGARRWVVIAFQPATAAHEAMATLFWQLGAGAAIVALAGLVAVLALGRISSRNRHLAEELDARNRSLTSERNVLRNLIDTIPDHIFIKDTQGRYILGNMAHARFHRLPSPEYVVGKRTEDLFRPEWAERYRADDQRVLASGQPIIDREEQVCNSAGIWRWVATTKFPWRDGEGNIVGLVCVSRDITEQRKISEEMRRLQNFLNSVIEDLPNMVFVKDAHSRKFVRFNRAGEELLGIPREELIGKSDHDFYPKDEADAFYAHDSLVLESAQLVDVPSEPIHTRDKGVRILHTRKIPILDGSGRPAYLLGVSVDVTELRKAEAQLSVKNQELARSNRELEQFAYVASHDLQEPLRMVASYLQLIERRYRDKLDAPAHDFIDFAVDGAKRMQVMINDLLAYSRVGTRGKALVRTSCEEILARVLKNLEVAIAETHAVVTHDPLPEIMVDASQLDQLLQNLIGNAVKFHGSQPPQVHIRARRVEGGEKLWEFAVRDNGLGIAPEHFERIFQIFQRLHSRAEYPGTGIGLALARRIVERHGGRIWLESAVGQGSTFYFTIPDQGAEV
jgi:PAS domain S-box-containing protein